MVLGSLEQLLLGAVVVPIADTEVEVRKITEQFGGKVHLGTEDRRRVLAVAEAGDPATKAARRWVVKSCAAK